MPTSLCFLKIFDPYSQTQFLNVSRKTLLTIFLYSHNCPQGFLLVLEQLHLFISIIMWQLISVSHNDLFSQGNNKSSPFSLHMVDQWHLGKQCFFYYISQSHSFISKWDIGYPCLCDPPLITHHENWRDISVIQSSKI